MALVFISNVEEGVRMGLWRMDETPAELLARYPQLQRLEMPYKNGARQREFLCVRALLLEMTGDDTLVIGHEDSGRPVVEGWQLSISHTKGYAVLMLSREKTVGVDIEYRSDRIVKIASHFIRPDEWADFFEFRTDKYGNPLPTAVQPEVKMLALWCAKETLYKLYSEDNLPYFDMRMQGYRMPDTDCPRGTIPVRGYSVRLRIDNLKRGEQTMVHVFINPDYCLTWAVGK